MERLRAEFSNIITPNFTNISIFSVKQDLSIEIKDSLCITHMTPRENYALTLVKRFIDNSNILQYAKNCIDDSGVDIDMQQYEQMLNHEDGSTIILAPLKTLPGCIKNMFKNGLVRIPPESAFTDYEYNLQLQSAFDYANAFANEIGIKD